jgi:glycosyltransferase involved in cell wall biosynthesis
MASSKNRKNIWITWERQRRSIELSEALDARLYVLAESSGDIPNRLLRYARLSAKTIRAIRENKPQVVFVQNPSICLAVLTCLLKNIFNYTLVVDRHSNFKFDKPLTIKWRLFHWLSRYTLRTADLTIITNPYLAQVVEAAGGTPFILQDKLPTLDLGKSQPSAGVDNIVFVSSFGGDEPTLEVIAAAKELPSGWRLGITGNARKFIKNKPADCIVPDNVDFLGFLAEDAYQSALGSAELILVLTNNDHTLTCGAYEAVTLGKPMVLSDTRAIRDYFVKGAEYCKTDAGSISQALLKAIENRDRLQAESIELKTELETSWQLEFQKLMDIVSTLEVRSR